MKYSASIRMYNGNEGTGKRITLATEDNVNDMFKALATMSAGIFARLYESDSEFKAIMDGANEKSWFEFLTEQTNGDELVESKITAHLNVANARQCAQLW